MGKIVFGNRNFGYAPITNSGGQYAFGTPVMLKGLVSTSAEIEQENTRIFADDMVWCVVDGAKTRSLTASFRYITEAYSEMLGFKKNDNGVLSDTGLKPRHCVFFETEEKDCETGEATRTLHYFYNVMASEPALETSTTEEEIESAELEIEYNAIESTFITDDDGNYVSYAKVTRTEANKTWYDTFTTKVLTPTDVI